MRKLQLVLAMVIGFTIGDALGKFAADLGEEHARQDSLKIYMPVEVAYGN